MIPNDIQYELTYIGAVIQATLSCDNQIIMGTDIDLGYDLSIIYPYSVIIKGPFIIVEAIVWVISQTGVTNGRNSLT